MKKKLIIVFLIMILMCAAGIGTVKLYETVTNRNGSTDVTDDDDKFTVVSSFYPIYVILENIADGAVNVEVHNLTENATGCLHDYTLSTKDMKRLANADLLIVNGIDTEPFLDDIKEIYPELPTFSCTGGISLICSEGHVHNHEHGDAGHETGDAGHSDAESGHEHGDTGHASENDGHNEVYNGHVWTDMNRYLIQIENVCGLLCDADPDNAGIYRQNTDRYRAEVEKLRDGAEAGLAGICGERVIIFHDSFAYFADEFGMEIAYTLELEDDEALSGGEIAKIIEIVNTQNVRYLFVEKQYSDALAKGIEKETDAEIICLDSMVTGNGEADSYLKSMEENIKVLKQIMHITGAK